MFYKVLAAVSLSFALSACVSTDATPLAKNVYSLNADGRGAFGGRKSATRKALIKEAAELTLQKGYTHFIIANPRDESSSTYIGSTGTTANTSGSATLRGNTIYGQSQTNVFGGVPIYSERASSSAVVVMFAPTDPRSENAVDAAQFLAEL